MAFPMNSAGLYELRLFAGMRGQAVNNVLHYGVTQTNPLEPITSTTFLATWYSRMWTDALTGLGRLLTVELELVRLEVWDIVGQIFDPTNPPYTKYSYGASDVLVATGSGRFGQAVGEPFPTYVAAGGAFRGVVTIGLESIAVRGGMRIGGTLEAWTSPVFGPNQLTDLAYGNLQEWFTRFQTAHAPNPGSVTAYVPVIGTRKIRAIGGTPAQNAGFGLTALAKRLITTQNSRKQRVVFS